MAYWYSADRLYSLRTYDVRLSVTVRRAVDRAGCSDYNRRRGRRAGVRVRQRSCLSTRTKLTSSLIAGGIPVLLSDRFSPVCCADCKSRKSVRRTVCRLGNPKPFNIGVFNAQSVANKSASICEWIISDSIDAVAVTESWHDGPDSPSIIACTPAGYSFIEAARPRSLKHSHSTKANHGGVCLFYRNTLQVNRVMLGNYSTFEYVSGRVHSSCLSVLIIVIYRPGSTTAKTEFFEEFSDLLGRAVTNSMSLLLAGDINIHLDDLLDTNTVKFKHLIALYGLSQHVSTPTHRDGHCIDVLVSCSGVNVASVHVYSPMILSDHSQIVANVSFDFHISVRLVDIFVNPLSTKFFV
jgi:hypothetical protein